MTADCTALVVHSLEIRLGGGRNMGVLNIMVAVSIAAAMIAYVIGVIYTIIRFIRQHNKCKQCPYKFPGCRSEILFTSMSECYADRHLTPEDRAELMKKINELDD